MPGSPRAPQRPTAGSSSSSDSITVLIAIGLWNGAGWARLVVTALMIVRIIGSIWVAFALSGHGGFLVGTIAGGLAVIVLLLLWNGRSDAFFNAT